jgi:hypothetical protein
MRIIATLNSKSGHNFGHNWIVANSVKTELSKTDVRYWQERIVKHSRQVDGTAALNTQILNIRSALLTLIAGNVFS